MGAAARVSPDFTPVVAPAAELRSDALSVCHSQRHAHTHSVTLCGTSPCAPNVPPWHSPIVPHRRLAAADGL